MRGIGWLALVAVLLGTAAAPAAGQSFPNQGSSEENAPTPAKQRSPGVDKEEEHKPVDPDTGETTLSNKTLGLLPNPFESRGLKFTATYISDSMANATGGLRPGATYEGRLNLAIDADFAKLAQVAGLSFHANMFQIHGRGLSRNDIGNLMPVSSLEALPTTRLYEMWFEQKFDGDRYSIRAGQLAADAEFITAKYTDALVSATFGWPAITAIDLPSGGPSPPLAAMGARLKAEIDRHITVLAAIFDGNAAGPGADDPQLRDRYGLNFRVNDPPLILGQIQYAWNQQKGAPGLPGTAKLGGWFHDGLFDDQRFAASGLSLAVPGAGAPLQHRGNFGVYGVAEQMLLRLSTKDDRNIGMFARVSASPDDRNLIALYADSGFAIKGPFAARPDDTFGFGLAYARISNRARALDQDFNLVGTSPRPPRDFEALAIASYQIQVREGFALIPNVQYVMHPGGGYVLDDVVPVTAKDALVFGVRTLVRF
ncbi:MAG TPA: carbohydrate porin [Xanthobacteraceae bacterium]|nr:carbohydrate porin [Xanthobacteraceae bacterium]